MTEYFFDTYATMALLQGTQEYMKYDPCKRNHSVFNTAELAWILERRPTEGSKEVVENAMRTVLETTAEDLLEASSIRKASENMSMTDAIGYAMAKRLGMLFLTGDKEFENLDNVEFVRAD